MRTLKVLVAASLIFPFLLSAQDLSTEVRLADRSDWWSTLNDNFFWPIDRPTSDELNADNFEIVGLKLEEHDPSFRAVKGRFGRAVSASRGDATSARHQICYVSDRKPPVRLIFEEGDLNLAFYLFEGGLAWNGQALCAESSQVTSSLRTKSGLGLGMSPAEVEAVLGKADISNPTKLVYQREVEKRTPDDKLAALRLEHSELSDKDFHDNYDSYDVELYIEARFTDGKLTYLAVSRAESY
jgi:hypothetical protein